MYAGWCDGFSQISISTSANGGVAWSTDADVPHGSSSLIKFSPNLQTGRTGRVYVVWSRMQGTSPNFASTRSFGFSEMSTLTPLAFHAETILLDNGVHDVNDSVELEAWTVPSMVVDRSDGTQDRLFVVWADNTVANGPEILMMRGSAALPTGSVVWETANLIKVNQSTDTDAIQWWPWITWDECSDMLVVCFMERIGANVDTRVAVSEDHGNTWTDFKVSDVSWSGAKLVNGYDYIGIGSGDGRAFPVWSDPREQATQKAFTSPIMLWGIASVSHVVQALPGDLVRVIVTWVTNLRADAANQLAVIPPPGIPAGTVIGYTLSADGETHTATYEGPCVPGHGTWRYTVTSQRTGCQQSRTGSGTFSVPYCVD